jgi:alpha-beta hydrolase superfamily lysophospholipase
MNANFADQSPTPPANGLGEPLYFPVRHPELFGWLHMPSDGTAIRSAGVVLCKPFGYEALCANRGVRVFAERLATLGLPTLRFDYRGTGDALDIDPQSDQIQLWTEDIVTAVAELRQRTGVEEVYLLGFRLGALLAWQAAACCRVDGLALLAPVVSGSRYLRDLRTARLAALSGAAETDRAPATDGSLEASGYRLTAASIKTLSDLNLANLASNVPRVLLIDRNDLPAAKAWSVALTNSGVQCDYHALAGTVQMLMTAPQFAAVPQAMLHTTGDWLASASAARVATRAATVVRSRDSTAAGALQVPGETDEALVAERPVLFGSEGRLFGVVTEPRRDEARRRAVILLNAAADHHSAASRMHVTFARAWARRGYVVLRMDLAGVGDSATRAGRPDDEVFPPAALDDIRDAVQFVRTHYGSQDVTLAGLCSGAYHTLRAGVAGVPVNRLLMVNPLNFFWKEGMTLQGLQLAEVVHNPGVYRERLVSAGAWKRLLTGQVNVWRIIKIYCHRPLLTLQGTLRDAARALRIRLPFDLGSELEELASRGIRMVFVFSRNDPGIELLKIEAGASIRRLGERCRRHIIEGGDHTFTHAASRAELQRILSEELFARHATLRSSGDR